jgi:V8-like Glu-specific endopeptidase
MKLNSVSNFPAPEVPLDPVRLFVAGSPGEAAGEELALQPALPKSRVAPIRSTMHFLRNANRSLVGGALGIETAAAAVETVIMDDGRERVKQTSMLPWRMICALSITGSNGIRAVGTGWLIGPRTLVTAGHCVHHQDLGGWAKRIEISAGRNASEFPYGTVVATRFSALQEWTVKHAPELDFGCIHLSESLGDKTGWFSLKPLTDSELKDKTVAIAGYPADRGEGTELYRHAQKILRVDPQRLYYDVDTFGGQSGSPAWLDPMPGTTPVVVGIHAYGVAGTPAAYDLVANSATRLIPPVLAEITRWCAQSDAA